MSSSLDQYVRVRVTVWRLRGFTDSELLSRPVQPITMPQLPALPLCQIARLVLKDLLAHRDPRPDWHVTLLQGTMSAEATFSAVL